ncbi:hypothetical protein GCM10020254_18840 [Streptomyces goshikiensis]
MIAPPDGSRSRITVASSDPFDRGVGARVGAAGQGGGRDRVDGAAAEQLAQREGQFGGVQGGAGGEAQDTGGGVDQVVRVGALDPGAVAAGPGDGPGQVAGRQGLRGAQQELVHRAALGERVGLQGQDVDAVVGERDAERGQAAGLVTDGGPHPPQGGVGPGPGGGVGAGLRESGRARIGGRCAARRRCMAVAAGPPGVERRRDQECHGRGDQQDRAPGAVRDEIGDAVGHRDGAEQGGEFDEVTAPVVAVGGRGRRQGYVQSCTSLWPRGVA